jgi:hypothetical protein
MRRFDERQEALRFECPECKAAIGKKCWRHIRWQDKRSDKPHSERARLALRAYREEVGV